jgi:carbon-monoxide dehydrogenase large subunit
MRVLGRREPRLEDREVLLGRGRYVHDLDCPGAAHVVYARSSMAHALISVDLEEVRRQPGVLAAFVAEDLGLPDLPPPAFPGTSYAVGGIGRPFLARERVRFVGEPVAAVVIEDQSLGDDVLEFVDVEYEALAPVVDPDAARRDETLLFPEAGSNVVASFDLGNEGWPGFDGCDVVLRQTIVNHRVLAVPLEVRGCVSSWDEGGRVTIWVSTQAPHLAKLFFAAALGVAPDQVRICTPAVGGGFGAKSIPYPDELLVPHLARVLKRPLRWSETRSESMTMLTPGRGQVTAVTVGADRTGRIHAVDYDVVQDNGAYAGLGTFMPQVGWLVASGPYAIEHARLRGVSVVTNTTPTGAYRGAGRPEPALCLERMMDLLAAELNIDVAEIRRRNLLTAGQYPFETATGTVYDPADPATALEKVLAAAGYEDLRKEQSRRRRNDDPRRFGVGLSAFVDIAGRVSPPEFGAVLIRPDGGVVVRTGASPHGQGHATAWAMLVADRLGVDLDRVELRYGDTDEIPVGGGTFGSKSLQSAGIAVDRASVGLIDDARRYAAELLEAHEDDVVLDAARGLFHVAGTPAVARSWGDVAAAAQRAGRDLQHEVVIQAPQPTFPSGVYLAVVSVDIETGAVRLERMITCDDAGRIVNPLIAEGQVHGGLAQGIAQALFEELRYDEAGNPLTSTLADYLVPSAAELPFFEGQFQETPSDRNELGVKGIGESGTIGATPAVANAVIDVLSEFGIRHLDLPLTPERVWRALHHAG